MYLPNGRETAKFAFKGIELGEKTNMSGKISSSEYSDGDIALKGRSVRNRS